MMGLHCHRFACASFGCLVSFECLASFACAASAADDASVFTATHDFEFAVPRQRLKCASRDEERFESSLTLCVVAELVGMSRVQASRVGMSRLQSKQSWYVSSPRKQNLVCLEFKQSRECASFAIDLLCGLW